MNLHLLDGTYELFRGFYGPPPKKAPDGREVGATVALLRSLMALLAEPGVSHLAVAFDHVVESFRNDLFAGYKTGEGIDPLLKGQFELAEEAVAAVLAQFGRIDDFPGDFEAWGLGGRAKRLKENLDGHRDAVALYRELTMLRMDVPLKETLADLEWRGARPVFREFCVGLGVPDLPEKVMRWL